MIPFMECCNYSQDHSVYLSSGLCVPCSAGEPLVSCMTMLIGRLVPGHSFGKYLGTTILCARSLETHYVILHTNYITFVVSIWC